MSFYLACGHYQRRDNVGNRVSVTGIPCIKAATVNIATAQHASSKVPRIPPAQDTRQQKLAAQLCFPDALSLVGVAGPSESP